MRLSKCKVCRTPFQKRSISHKVCSPACAITLNEKEKEVKRRKEYLAAKVKLRSRAEWQKEAQKVFNQFIRTRDEHAPCISCGRYHTGQYHAGHYLTTGAHPELRFDEANCHKQCSVCNNHLSGNIAAYRINLLAKIGAAEVDRLESYSAPKKWSIEELQEIKRVYTTKIKELKRGEK